MLRKLILAGLFALLATGAQAANKAYISEFGVLGTSNNGVPQIAAQPSLTEQTVDFSGGVTSSAAFGGGTKYIRILCDSRCSVQFGAAPTATTSKMPLAADTPEYFGVQPGEKVSVIANP
jgi:hypothetical protein